jgi:hypothetical protein
VPDDVGAVDTDGVEDPDDVPDERRQRVLRDALGPVRRAETTQVRCDDPVAGADQRGDLVAPQRRRVGEPVQQQHRRPVALVDDVEGQFVDRDGHAQLRSGVSVRIGIRRGAVRRA